MLFNFILTLSLASSFPGDSIPTPVSDSTITAAPAAYDYFIVNNVLVLGNKVTKRFIIMRELSFSENDTIRYTQLDEKLKTSKQNLLNTSLFNFVTIDTFDTRANRANIIITVKERWYTWPVPIFELADR